RLASAGSSHQPELDAHLQRAVTGAIEGSLLAKNLVTHAQLRVRAGKLADLRAQVGHAKPSPVCHKPGTRSSLPRQNLRDFVGINHVGLSRLTVRLIHERIY